MRWSRITAAALFLVLSVETSFALSFKAPTDKQMIDQATAIVAGRVQSTTVQRLVTRGKRNGRTMMRSLHQFTVMRCWKACDQLKFGSQLVIESIGGRVGKNVVVSEGQPELEVNREYLVLLEKLSNNNWRVLHQEAGEAEVDLSVPLRLAAAPGSTKGSLDDQLRADFGLVAPPKKREAASLSANAPGSCCRHWTGDDHWPKFHAAPIVVRPPSVPDSKLGAEGSLRVITDSMDAWASRSGLTWRMGTPTAGKGPGFMCGQPGELLWSWEDPKGQITDPANCGGALAIGGYCGGNVQADGTREIVSAALVFGDGWHTCPWSTEDWMEKIGEHECGHCLGWSHSKEANEQCTQTDPACKARMYAYLHGGPMNICDDQCAVESYGTGSGDPTPTSTPTPSSAPTVTPTPRPTIDARCRPPAFRDANNKCQCPDGWVWNRKVGKCPLTSGKNAGEMARACRCVLPTPAPKPPIRVQ